MSQCVYAAVVKALAQVPRYELIDLSSPTANQVQVQVLAAGVHRIVKSIVSGQHYIKPKTMPIVPGIDGVGTLSNGTPNGSMSERLNIDSDMTIPPRIQPGESVLILGVTGSSGGMAAASARLLGAQRIIGVGRNTSILNKLLTDGKIDTSITLNDNDDEFQKRIEKEAADVDIVLDYLWGRPTEMTMAAIQSARKNAAQRLRWVEVGQMTGATIQCSGALLRSKNIEIIGSGIGPISTKDMLKSLTHMVPIVMEGKLTTSVKTISLKDIENQWEETANASERVVIVI